jgi:phosphatidylglycerol:prolipoprotein diacylglycerol transferase
MLYHPHINPEILPFNLFGFHLAITWYGLMYVTAFLIGYLFYRKKLLARNIVMSREQYENYVFAVMLGVILGGRLGYILFYGLPYYIANPSHVFAVWEGGMSFHGGCLGAITAVLIYCHKNKFRFMQLADPSMPFIAVGLGLGRIGNFINGELYGKPTSVAWGMIFPNSDGLPRHPTQIYEMFLEGIVLFVVSQYLLKKQLKDGTVFWVFILLYGIFRFTVEFVREPDNLSIYQNGLLYGFLPVSQGQFLSLLMVLVAGIGLIFLYRKKGGKDVTPLP